MNDRSHLFSSTNQPDPSRRNRGPLKTRSVITSGKFDGIDGRTGVGRRYLDLCRAFEREAREAGAADISTVGKTLIRQAASLTMRCEELQAAQLKGKKISIDDLVRMTSEIRRILAAVTGKQARNQAAAPSLLETYLDSEPAA
jgi:hypothetical protein